MRAPRVSRRSSSLSARIARTARALGIALVGAGVSAALASCGARTGLYLGHDPCSEEGEQRACQGVCGEGLQTCEDGFFGECVVPARTRSCENACGQGTQRCEQEVWGQCEVPETSRACTNRCGTGTTTCADGEWGACEVAPVEEPCTNTCGSGTRTCADGVSGECRVPPVSQPCENLCGSGVQVCRDGVFGECEVPIVQRDCASVCGPGHETCAGGAWQPCDAPQPNPPKLDVVIRDFKIEHPDFEIEGAGNFVETGIVDSVLGPDDKPIYRGDPLNGTTSGPDTFYQWFNDVPGVNWSRPLALDLGVSAQTPGLFFYENTSFFPIDGELFGNEGNRHNYHFTLEAKTTFQYIGGEVFRFTGDDDMWVFVNRRLAIDLGGLHTPRSASVELDSIALGHGLVVGETYPLHFFFAERHTIESNFTIHTSIAEPGSCD